MQLWNSLDLDAMNTPNHELSMTVLMTPDMANFSGNVHGGTVLKFLDQVAYACASRYAARYVVTVIEGAIMLARTYRDRALLARHLGCLKEYLAQNLGS